MGEEEGLVEVVEEGEWSWNEGREISERVEGEKDGLVIEVRVRFFRSREESPWMLSLLFCYKGSGGG